MPRLVAAAAAVAVIAGGATAYALSTQSGSAPRRGAPLTPLQRAEAANRALAVAWVVGQVSPSAVVSCDPKTCTALIAHHYPSANVRSLGPTSGYPKDSSVVVETASVRGIFGTSLASLWAPGVLDTIGSGQAQVTIRVIAPHGSAAYQRALSTDLVNREHNGASLVGSRQITTSAVARRQLAAGQVDSRLLFAVLAMAGAYPLDVLDFGNLATGASADLPLRYADLAEHVPATRLTDAAYAHSMISALEKLPGGFRPLWTQTVSLPGGVVALRVAYSAPSPLGLLAPSGG
jgi:hypothetical protein